MEPSLHFLVTSAHQELAAGIALMLWQIIIPEKFADWEAEVTNTYNEETLTEHTQLAMLVITSLQDIGRIPSTQQLLSIADSYLARGITLRNSDEPTKFVQKYNQDWETAHSKK